MLWTVSIYLIFLFYYTCNSQITYAPLNVQIADHEASVKQKLKLNVNAPNGSIVTLKAKVPYEHIQLPSQWVQEAEGPHWPGGEVRYYVDSDSYGEGVVNLLTMAFNSIRYASDVCPKFLRLDEKRISGNYLHFTNPDRVRPCVHEPAVNRAGEIKVVLGYDCLKPREVLHTVLHGLGFRDEITHPKRDLFVRVMWENIQPAFRYMFRLQTVEAVNGLAEYDPKSVMHFHDRAYSVNGQATVVPMLPGLKIEPSDKLSHLDLMKIRRIFGHECKKLQIGNILKDCGVNLACKDYQKRPGSKPECEERFGNDGEMIGPGQVTDSNEGRIIIPGNDVRPEGSNEAGVIIPGNDVRPEDGNEAGVIIPGNNVRLEGSNEARVIIPGNDVRPEGGIEDSNEGVVAIPGNDVRPEGGNVGAIAVTDNENDKVIIAGSDVEAGDEGVADADHSIEPRGNDLPSDEAIIVGYNAESTERKLSKTHGNKKLSQTGLGGKHIPDTEAIVVGAYENGK